MNSITRTAECGQDSDQFCGTRQVSAEDRHHSNREELLMSESLPEWVEVGAEAILTWGLRGEHVQRMSVTRVTPSGQVVVTTGSSRGERRFMLRDFQKDGTAHKYARGAFPNSSLYLYPLSHPKVPLLIAKQEYAQAWSRVERTMSRLREAETDRTGGDSEQYVDALIEQLAAWRRAKVNLSGLS